MDEKQLIAFSSDSVASKMYPSKPHKMLACSTSYLFLFAWMLMILSGCGSVRKTAGTEVAKPEQTKQAVQKPVESFIDPKNIPETPREMRAVWVASVANIDWPSAPGLPVSQQKAELRAIMDRVVQLNMNAIILQVRPAADALYDSPYEPWSEFLTGKQGRAPAPFYDPLKFAIEEAHLRGLQLHAWVNPFRAYHYEAKTGFAPSHIKNRKPELVVQYGRYWWLDPGQKEARQYSLDVILDIAHRYDIDGIHLDDYFYPYPEKNASGAIIPFPDDTSYHTYEKKHGGIDRGDWRRQNINHFVEQLYQELENIKPDILFGISPFGIWRPGNPSQIKGFDAYANIFADAKTWFNKGWVDYLSPQLYWPIDRPAQSFPVLLKWWQQQNTFNRYLWPGLYTNRVGTAWNAPEIGRQIELTRRQKGVTGNVHFSATSLMQNTGNIATYLLKHEYAEPALVPAKNGLATQRPPQLDASIENTEDYVHITLNPAREYKPWKWVLKLKYGTTWKVMISPGGFQGRTFPLKNENGSFKGAVLSFVDRLGNESAPQMLLPIMADIENPE